MLKSDFKEFVDMLDDVYSLTGNGVTLSANAKALFFMALKEYTIDIVRQAMSAHINDEVEGKFQPKPAHLIEKIKKINPSDNWMEANEAWAIIPKNEKDSAIVTNEAMDAFSFADRLSDYGDKIGARMAFISRYNALVEQAKIQKRKPVYFISFGTDEIGREKVLIDAVSKKILTIDKAISFLPHRAEFILIGAGITQHPILIKNEEKKRIELSSLIFSFQNKQNNVN